MKIDMVSVHCILCKLMNFSSTLADSDGSLGCLMVSAAENNAKVLGFETWSLCCVLGQNILLSRVPVNFEGSLMKCWG